MTHVALFATLIALGGCGSLDAARSAGSEDGALAGEFRNFAAERRGAGYAQTRCADCHAIGATGESPLAAAPHFRALGLRYPVEDLAESFAEGIFTAHPAMPEFVMSRDENADLIAYLKSIQTRRNP